MYYFPRRASSRFVILEAVKSLISMAKILPT